MSGRGASEATARTKAASSDAWALRQRLKSHRSGRRSGDQFCVYVGDRLVLPRLTRELIEKITNGSVSFESLIREFIEAELPAAWSTALDGAAALDLEVMARIGIANFGLPALNGR